MPTTVPAMRGNFGSFEYWVTTMRVGELLKNIVIPKDIEGWESMSLEEKYQRDINTNRVKRDIAPYFATDPDRFSGALIVAVQNHDGMQFESLSTVGANGKLPALYVSAAENIGFLTLSGGEQLVPLDGQHRAKAFEYALKGKDETDKPIKGVPVNPALANEDVVVILVRFDSRSSRRIFNKVNRYAKPTSKGQNLITDDDDAIAVLTRAMTDDEGLLPARLIRYKSNTLSAIAPEFTTLATLYDANVAIAEDEPGSGKVHKPTDEQRAVYHDAIVETWSMLLDRIELFREALQDTTEAGDARRQEIRDTALLGKPIGQLVLVKALLELRKRRFPVPDDVTTSYWQTNEEICARLNKVDWSIGNEQWRGVLTNAAGRVLSGKTTVNFAALFVAHLCGAELCEDEQLRLREHIWGEGTERELPEPVA